MVISVEIHKISSDIKLIKTVDGTLNSNVNNSIFIFWILNVELNFKGSLVCLLTIVFLLPQISKSAVVYTQKLVFSACLKYEITFSIVGSVCQVSE